MGSGMSLNCLALYLRRSFRAAPFLGMMLLCASLLPVSAWADSRFFGGDDIALAAPLQGDAVILARDIRISAPVDGSIDAIGQSVRLNAPVSGDVRLGGQDLRVNGLIEGALDAYGMRIVLGAASRIEEQVTLSGNDIVIQGRLDENLTVEGQHILLNGRIDGDATIKAARLEIGPDARLRGQIIYQGIAAPIIDPDARISGDLAWGGDREDRWWPSLRDWLNGMPAWREGERYFAFYADAQQIGRGGLIALLLLSAVITLLFPSVSAEIQQLRHAGPLRAFLVGLLLIVFFPIAAFLIMGTIFGIVISLFLMLVYFALLLAGIVATVIFLGGMLLERVGERREQFMWRLGEVGAGAVALWLIAHIPLIAMPSLFLLLALGVGLATLAVNRRLTEARLGVGRPKYEAGKPPANSSTEITPDKGDSDPPVAR